MSTPPTKRTDHERELLITAWRRCDEQGNQANFWRLLKIATALHRLQEKERAQCQTNS